jgi:hypothetical protein
MRMFALALLLLATPAAAQAPVGRVAVLEGTLALRPAGGAFGPIGRGAALAEAQTLRTGPRGQAELELGANRVGLDPDTVLRIDSAHPATPAFTLQQGRAMLLIRSLQPGQVARLDLPGGSVTLAQPGLYTVQAAEPGRAGSVGVSRGMAQLFGPGLSLMVPAGQTALFGDAQPARLRAGVAEGFLADDPTMAAPRVVHPSPPIPPVAVAPDLDGLPGAEVLLREGDWVASPDYGPVWYPPVAPGWDPYAGAWGGASWGYVPWRQGVWVMIGPRWGWLPPPHRRHVPPPAYRHGRLPPGLGQPYPQPPHVPSYPPYVGHRPPPPPFAAPPVAAPPIAAPHVFAPRSAPPPFAAPAIAPPRYAPPPPPPAMAPPGMPPRAPAVANPAPSAPHIFAPRAPAPVFAAPPPAAAPRPAAPPARSCPPGRPFC